MTNYLNQHPDDPTEIVLATREILNATMGLLEALDQMDESRWWPLFEAETACATHCSWAPQPLPIRSVAKELRLAAAELRINCL